MTSFDYYTENRGEFYRLLESGEQTAYSVNWNGVKYSDGVQMFTYLNNEYIYEDTFLFTDCWYDVCEFAVRVPVGYDGAVFSAYNHNAHIESIMLEGVPLGVIDADVLSNGDTLTFRLN